MMKFHLFYVLTLCACFGQICAEGDEWIIEQKQKFRDQIFAVGEQFVEDLATILERNRNNSYILQMGRDAFQIVTRRIPKEQNIKIDVNQVKSFSSDFNFAWTQEQVALDSLKIFQAILSKQFPPERYNGVVNLLFACVFNSATTEEIQSALNYLYGIDIEATKTSFLDSRNLSIIYEYECTSNERLSLRVDALRELVGIKPKVMQDFLAIREKFICNRFVASCLYHFVAVIQDVGGDKGKINACMIKETPGHWLYTKEYVERDVETSESILSTRLPDETFRGIINLKRVTLPDTPIEEIEKALEYLYDDVPKSNCSTTENSTLKAE